MREARLKEGATRKSHNRGTPLPGLRAARQRRGLTQRGLAVLAGTGSGTISDLETSRRGAYPRTTRKLASTLKVEVDHLTSNE
ncbi:MAG: helix-turn-helix transcriptional regulator [Actinobacteria bacterium]|nr:helix-turn-helix transcriptional regulator [Actinomycetota bacterium]